MLISKLQTLEPKDWAGLTTDNHLGALYMQQPQLVNEVIEHIYKVNLGGDDVVSFINQFPLMYIDDDVPFDWLLQGADEKNIPLIAYWDSTYAAAPARAGIARTSFWMEFGERLFEATDLIVGEKPELYKLRIVADPTSRGTSWLYEVQLNTGDDTLFVPADQLAAGTRWSKDYSPVEQTLSKRGGGITHTSPFRMRNWLSMIRKQYTVPGNMIRKGANKPLAFAWVDQDGKKITSWLGKLDWDFLAQFRRERARLLLYGNANKLPDGTFGATGESGYELKTGYGLYEQVAPSNTFFYNTFNLDWLTEVALGLSVGKLPEDQRRFVLSTGEYGAYQFHSAVEDKTSGWTPNFTDDRISISGNKMTYRGQFNRYVFVNGIEFEVMIDPMLDNPVRNKVQHPDGGLASSREYNLWDFGTSSGEPNIQRVALKGDEEIYKYIPGMRDPFSPYNNQTKPGMTASSVDGYEVHKMFIGGLRVKNPMRTARIIPSLLA